ncbi:MAG TPA: UDP-N-acetylglucosamine 2-epimerase (non-hydrolyzing) [Polyangia bacterium]|nr:UDP-N-acetylglucosamine 2-epimerase (non-hydrolyzing) [Polyangia bacterium]
MIAIVLGTRPEIIKTAPVIFELAARGIRFRIIHTGQHYSPSLDRVFFDELGLPAPAVNLETGSLPPARQVARMIEGLADALEAERPRAVLLQGDTNSVLAGALAAHKLGIPIAHLEAGLRSDDWTMPEEGNRIVAGRLAAVHFCPTPLQAERLAGEGIEKGVYVVGNTVVDACLHFAERARRQSDVLSRLGLERGRYGLLTMHRPSNVDARERLDALTQGLAAMATALDARLVFPVHPRTRASAAAFGLLARLGAPPFVTVEPVGYLDLLALLEGARFVATDSGGLQEEACTLRVPCLTLRPNTERPETVTVGANVLCDASDGVELERALRGVMISIRQATNPFGDGRTAARVVDVLVSPETRWLPSGQP